MSEARPDPVRMRYLEALSRRLQGQSEPVRRLLQEKLQRALADDAQRLAQASQAGGDAAALPRARPRSPLAQLNERLRRERQEHDAGELASARRFRRAWSNARSQAQVEQAASRKPANPGPLNSHVLVLESLAMMRELSPDYLRHFLLHVQSLQQLEQLNPSSAPTPGRPARAAKPAARSRPRKT